MGRLRSLWRGAGRWHMARRLPRCHAEAQHHKSCNVSRYQSCTMRLAAVCSACLLALLLLLLLQSTAGV